MPENVPNAFGDETTHKYDDIINLPHPDPRTRPRMSMRDRAAQFAPFAALKHQSLINEEHRLTERKVELEETDIDEINFALAWINDHVSERPLVSITYFIPDARKEGGAYEARSGEVLRIDPIAGQLIFTDRSFIALSDIYQIKLLDAQIDADSANDCN